MLMLCDHVLEHSYTNNVRSSFLAMVTSAILSYKCLKTSHCDCYAN